jgi:hypothetical protein
MAVQPAGREIDRRLPPYAQDRLGRSGGRRQREQEE